MIPEDSSQLFYLIQMNKIPNKIFFTGRLIIENFN